LLGIHSAINFFVMYESIRWNKNNHTLK